MNANTTNAGGLVGPEQMITVGPNQVSTLNGDSLARMT